MPASTAAPGLDRTTGPTVTPVHAGVARRGGLHHVGGSPRPRSPELPNLLDEMVSVGATSRPRRLEPPPRPFLRGEPFAGVGRDRRRPKAREAVRTEPGQRTPAGRSGCIRQVKGEQPCSLTASSTLDSKTANAAGSLRESTFSIARNFRALSSFPTAAQLGQIRQPVRFHLLSPSWP